MDTAEKEASGNENPKSGLIYKALSVLLFFVKLAAVLTITAYVFLAAEKKAAGAGADFYGHQYNEIYDQAVKANIAVIGTSHVTHGFNPKFIEKPGRRYFNFALNGSNPAFYLEWYREVFKKSYVKPEVMIIGVDWFGFDENWLWRRFENDRKYMREKITFKKLLGDVFAPVKTISITGEASESIPTPDIMVTRVMNEFVFFANRGSLDKIFSEKPADGEFLMSTFYKGFVCYHINTTYPVGEVQHPAAANLKSAEENFLTLLDEIEADGIKIIFLTTPEYTPGRENTGIKAEIEHLHAIADERGIPYFEYIFERASDFNTNPEYFWDWGHMNGVGAEEFTKIFAGDVDSLMREYLG